MDTKASARAQQVRTVRVLHAPSDPVAKGTAEIRDAVAALRKEGIAFEFVELSRVSHAMVVAEMQRADLVIDQLYSDQPMPGFATEAASMGKPVVIGGYDWDVLQKEGGAPAWPPTIQIRPNEVMEKVREFVIDGDLRAAAGERARTFVQEFWLPKRVAERFIRLALGDFPNDWLFSPTEIQALHGYGISARASRDVISSLISHGGVGALGLSHCPDVERRVLDRICEPRG